MAHHLLNTFSPEMPFAHLRFSVPNLPLKCAPNTLLGPIYSYMVDSAHLQPTMVRSNIHLAFMKSISHTFTFTSTLQRVHSTVTFQLGVNAGESSEIGQCLQPQPDTGLLLKQTLSEGIQVPGSVESVGDVDDKELQRRRKIGLANKGKIPWNKGRKHSAETRERIKQRTIEALKDPKVRRKMSEYPHAHSEQSKARIGLSQRQVWAKRLKWKRLREKFYLKWVECIAEAAKIGGNDQNELDWDSYDKIKADIALRQLQLAADKAKAKEFAYLRAKRAAKEKAEKMARLAEKKKIKELKAKAKGETNGKARRKSKEERQKLAISKGLKLKARITKIHKKTSINGQVTTPGDMATGHQTAIEKWDLEFIRREKMRKEVSLAEQIQAAKNKRAEYAAGEDLTTTLACPPVTWQGS